MNQVFVFTFSVRREGEREPDIEGTIRLPVPEGDSLEEVLMEAARRACREMHLQQPAWRIV